MASLEESWNEATAGLDARARESWLARLRAAYSEEGRTYHNLDSLREKLARYAEIRGRLREPRAVLLALFFQNFEYDPRAVSEDGRSAELSSAFAEEAGLPADVAARTRELLLAAATHSTEAHKVGGAFGGEDAHYLLDLDMLVLGVDAERYAEYRRKIRGEYSFLSEPMYTALRLKVLQNFLRIPNIFATKEFRERYEDQARANIRAEIELLS